MNGLDGLHAYLCVSMWRVYGAAQRWPIQLFLIFDTFKSSTEDNCIGCTVINVVDEWMVGLESQNFRCT